MTRAETHSEPAKASKAAAQARYDEREAWRSVLASPSGRLVLETLIERSGFYDETPVGSAMTQVRIGMRHLGLEIRKLISQAKAEQAPATFAQMQTEYALFAESLK